MKTMSVKRSLIQKAICIVAAITIALAFSAIPIFAACGNTYVESTSSPYYGSANDCGGFLWVGMTRTQYQDVRYAQKCTNPNGSIYYNRYTETIKLGCE